MTTSHISPNHTDLEAAPKTTPEKPAATREDTQYMAPPVDIHESADTLTVFVDLPGVEKDAVDIRVEEGILTIQGKPEYKTSENLTYREFHLVNYYRQFQLSDAIDQSRISADLKHGVLTIQLPKAAKAKPRRIKVQVGS